MTAFFFYIDCAIVLVAAGLALFGTRRARASVACFQVSMFALVGVLVMIGAPVVAIAQFLFCVGLGLVYFFAADSVDDSDAVPVEAEFGARAPSRAKPKASAHWLVPTLGVAGACAMATLLFDVIAPALSKDLAASALSMAARASTFEAVGIEVVVHDGLALLGVGLVLLASAVGAGFLASKGSR